MSFETLISFKHLMLNVKFQSEVTYIQLYYKKYTKHFMRIYMFFNFSKLFMYFIEKCVVGTRKYKAPKTRHMYKQKYKTFSSNNYLKILKFFCRDKILAG